MRKKFLNQKVPIVFTQSQKKEGRDFISSDSYILSAGGYHGNLNKDPTVNDPWSLVGRHVCHRFIHWKNSLISFISSDV